MVTRVLMFEAGPTPWEAEDRLVGTRPLPLTAEAVDMLRHRLNDLPHPPNSVYRAAANEACHQAAALIAEKFDLRPRNNPELETVHLGLWEGLTRDEVRYRFPTVFPEWEDHPLSVTPPDAEPLEQGITRITGAIKRILRRNRGETVSLALRPMAMQIAIGALAGEPPETIAGHLQQQQSMATIELDEVQIKAFLG